MKHLTSNFLHNGDVFTSYHDVGQGEPLVMLHGFMGSKVDFHDQIALFAGQRRVLAYDQRGHGETSNLSNADKYRFELLVEDLKNFLDQSDIEQCDLLGHSMGGMIAMRFALKYPERIRSLILMSTSASPVEVVPEPIRRLFCRKVRKKGCSVMLKTICSHPLASIQNNQMHTNEKQKQLERLAIKYDQMDPEAFVGLSEELTKHASVLAQLSAIHCPTTVLYGALDDVFREPARALSRAIPAAALIEVPNAAHSPHYENVDFWQSAVQDHLDRLRPTRSPSRPRQASDLSIVSLA